MVSNNTDLVPARGQERLDAIDEVCDQLRDTAGQTTPFMMARRIEIAVFSPGPARWVADGCRGEYLEAFIHKEPIEPVGGQVFAVTGNARTELFASRHPTNVPGYG